MFLGSWHTMLMMYELFDIIVMVFKASSLGRLSDRAPTPSALPL
jgi:hypothetical protein